MSYRDDERTGKSPQNKNQEERRPQQIFQRKDKSDFKFLIWVLLQNVLSVHIMFSYYVFLSGKITKFIYQ